MSRTHRNNNIVFHGNEADVYMQVCDGIISAEEQKADFIHWMNEHITIEYDSVNGSVIISNDELNLEDIENSFLVDYNNDIQISSNNNQTLTESHRFQITADCQRIPFSYEQTDASVFFDGETDEINYYSVSDSNTYFAA